MNPETYLFWVCDPGEGIWPLLVCFPVSKKGIIVPTFPGNVRSGDETGRGPGQELVCVGVLRIVATTIGDPNSGLQSSQSLTWGGRQVHHSR